MGTYWDVHCMTCDSAFGLHGRGADEAALVIAHAAPKLAEAAHLIPTLHVDVYETFGFANEGGPVCPIKWFADHAGHDIQAHNEYKQTHAAWAAEQKEWFG